MSGLILLFIIIFSKVNAELQETNTRNNTQVDNHNDLAQKNGQHSEDLNYNENVTSTPPNNTEINIANYTSLNLNDTNISNCISLTPPANCKQIDILQEKVYKSSIVNGISKIIGWFYFVIWSIVFYPIIYNNYTRKSVVGLNFDFLLLNLIGFLMYTIFNMGVYFIPEVREEYSRRHPGSPNPVQPNDIFFSSNGFISTIIMIYQCGIYESDNQRVSTIGRIITTGYAVLCIVLVVLANVGAIIWLDVLYVCSYVKLWITFAKYIPQVYMNYNRKSTGGFSIQSVILDFSGGLLSICQMVLDGYNYDDWSNIVGNPTKFGLGFVTIGFNIIFALQHFILYDNYIPINDSVYC